MRKVLLLVAFAAMAQVVSAQVSFRMGLDAGANLALYKAEFSGLLKDYIVDDVKPAVSPSGGLNLALDIALGKKKSMGFFMDYQFTSTHWSVSFGEDGSNNTLYKVSYPTVNLMEGVYFAFDLKKMKRKKKLQAQFGLGVYEDIRLKGKVKEEEHGEGYSTVPEVAAAASTTIPGFGMDDLGSTFDYPFNYDIGVSALAGIYYRLNEHFFIEGRVMYMLPLMGSSHALDNTAEMMSGMAGMSAPEGIGENSLNEYVSYKNDKINRIAFLATVGYAF